MNSDLFDPEFINSIYRFNPELFSTFSKDQNGGQSIIKHRDLFQTLDFTDDYPQTQTQTFMFNPNHDDGQSQGVPDFPDDCLKFISDILLEDLDQNPSSVQEVNALEATEKSLYDALGLDRSVDDISHSLLEFDSISNSSGSTSPVSTLPSIAVEKSIKGSSRRKKKSRQRDGIEQQGRGNKVQATCNEDYVEMEQFDDVVLLCNQENIGNKGVNTHKRVSQKKPNNNSDQVDLTNLLIQCAQAVSSFDLRTSNDLLKQIRQHASPYGDNIQRLAHHVGNALEARLAGTGSTISANLVDVRISASDFLRSYRLYVSAIPFKRMSFFLANRTIAKLAENATKIHIIDFGVFLGLQWPCLIQSLSKRPNGPPKLRVTGIDYPQQGFRPSERVEATGHRLSGYCKRFGVPFKYHGIAQTWENIQEKDLKIESDEVVIVNCMYRSGTLLDETVDHSNSPKDAFLKLVRNLNPDLFIHGIINGTFNAPFFVTRFREALFHYSSVFDVFEATVPREAHERLLIESEVFGKEVFNVVACEGGERVQRPETYKQWHVRMARAGLRKVGLDKELVSRAKEMVKANYHKEFVVDEDRDWMLQGWKGRTICALSFWKPT